MGSQGQEDLLYGSVEVWVTCTCSLPPTPGERTCRQHGAAAFKGERRTEDRVLLAESALWGERCECRYLLSFIFFLMVNLKKKKKSWLGYQWPRVFNLSSHPFHVWIFQSRDSSPTTNDSTPPPSRVSASHSVLRAKTTGVIQEGTFKRRGLAEAGSDRNQRSEGGNGRRRPRAGGGGSPGPPAGGEFTSLLCLGLVPVMSAP